MIFILKNIKGTLDILSFWTQFGILFYVNNYLFFHSSAQYPFHSNLLKRKMFYLTRQSLPHKSHRYSYLSLDFSVRNLVVYPVRSVFPVLIHHRGNWDKKLLCHWAYCVFPKSKCYEVFSSFFFLFFPIRNSWPDEGQGNYYYISRVGCSF